MFLLLLLDVLLPSHTNHTDQLTVSEFQTTTHTKNNNMGQLMDSESQDNTTTSNNMVQLTVLEFQDNTTTSNNTAQLTVSEFQDNTTVEKVTMVVKDTADTTDVSQPEDTEEEGPATQEEDTSRDVESSTVKKKLFDFAVLLF